MKPVHIIYSSHFLGTRNGHAFILPITSCFYDLCGKNPAYWTVVHFMHKLRQRFLWNTFKSIILFKDYPIPPFKVSSIPRLWLKTIASPTSETTRQFDHAMLIIFVFKGRKNNEYLKYE